MVSKGSRRKNWCGAVQIQLIIFAVYEVVAYTKEWLLIKLSLLPTTASLPITIPISILITIAITVTPFATFFIFGAGLKRSGYLANTKACKLQTSRSSSRRSRRRFSFSRRFRRSSFRLWSSSPLSPFSPVSPLSYSWFRRLSCKRWMLWFGHTEIHIHKYHASLITLKTLTKTFQRFDEFPCLAILPLPLMA